MQLIRRQKVLVKSATCRPKETFLNNHSSDRTNFFHWCQFQCFTKRDFKDILFFKQFLTYPHQFISRNGEKTFLVIIALFCILQFEDKHFVIMKLSDYPFTQKS